MKTATIKIVAASAIAFALSLTVSAQWMSQQITLTKGWNAIHLKVNPADAACSTVFADDGIEQVSWWNRDRLDDGTGAAITDFCNWYKASDGEPNTFGSVIGDQCYLVKATKALTLTVKGTPAIPRGTIYLGEDNLVGLNINNLTPSANAPFYYEYFKSFAGSITNYNAVTAENETLRISNKTKATDASKAIWISTKGSGIATFTGPFEISLGGANAAQTLSWTDDALKTRTISIKNTTSAERTLDIRLVSSLPPPTGYGTSAGDIALLRQTIDWSAGYANYVYEPFLNSAKTSFTTNIAAGATFELALRPDTSRMPEPKTGGDYMGIIEISDKGTAALDSSIRSYGLCLYRIGAFAAGSLAANDEASAAGLWVGTVVLSEVNRAKMLSVDDAVDGQWDSTKMLDAPHPFQFRLLVHVDASRNAKILKEVFTAKADADADTLLLTDRATAIAFRERYADGTIKRTSSANFPFMPPLALEGKSGGKFMDGALTATLSQAYDDRTNPFVHSFHPQHDNIEFSNQKPSKLGSGDEGYGDYESWGVTREITLTFDASDSTGAASPEAWNRTITGGTYEETIHGLTGQGKPIKTRGIFRLSKVNDTATLTTEVIP